MKVTEDFPNICGCRAEIPEAFGDRGRNPTHAHANGEPLRMPQTLLQYSPFHSYLIPGIILFVVNGLMSLLVLWLTVRAFGLWLVGSSSRLRVVGMAYR